MQIGPFVVFLDACYIVIVDHATVHIVLVCRPRGIVLHYSLLICIICFIFVLLLPQVSYTHVHTSTGTRTHTHTIDMLHTRITSTIPILSAENDHLGTTHERNRAVECSLIWDAASRRQLRPLASSRVERKKIPCERESERECVLARARMFVYVRAWSKRARTRVLVHERRRRHMH
jgi:hypothetical protein